MKSEEGRGHQLSSLGRRQVRGRVGGLMTAPPPTPQSQLTVSKDGSIGMSLPFFLQSDFDTPPNKRGSLCPLPLNLDRPVIQWK